MNARAFLYGVEFVQLKCGQRKDFVSGQVKGLPGRQGMRPITRTDIVVPARAESPGGRQEAIHRTNHGPGPVPAQDHGQKISVRKSTASAQLALKLDPQIIAPTS